MVKVMSKAEMSHREPVVDRVESSTFQPFSARAPILGHTELVSRLGEMLATKGSSSPGAGLAVSVVGLGGLERLRDAFGQQVSDEVLTQLAGEVGGSLGSDALLARMPEAKLVVMGGSSTTNGAAVEQARMIARTLSASRFVRGMRVRLDVFVGIAMTDLEGGRAEDLIGDADAAMHVARLRGPGAVEVFRPTFRRRLIDTLQLQGELVGAIEGDQLELDFQPIVSRGGEVMAMEASLRWRHPDRGLLTPAEFMSAAEGSGLMAELELWSLTEVCAKLGRWAAEGCARPPLISVNLSAGRLAERGFEDRFAATLAAAGVAPSAIAVELTESGAVELGRDAACSIEALRRIGTRVGIDDFGSGYSSLASLAGLSLDAIKLDRAFLNEPESLPGSSAILTAVTEMGHALGMLVATAGIETAAQLEAALGAGVDAVQGFFVARPMPIESAADLQGLLDKIARAPGASAGATDTPADRRIGLGEAAQLVGMSASTLRRCADRGEIAVFRTEGGHRRFRTRDVQRLARRRLDDPLLTPVRLPDEPLVQTADLLRERGAEVLEGVGRAMYERGRPGWFESPHGRRRTMVWLDPFAEAIGQGRHRQAAESTASLLERCRPAGASTAECVRFLREFARVCGAHLARAGNNRRAEYTGLQGLLADATEVFLDRIEP